MIDVKKLIAIILVVFVVFWLFQDPQGLADLSSDAFWWVVDAGEQTFQAMLEFIRGL